MIIRHRLGMTSWYAHLSRIAVRKGQCITGGDRIGRVGSTGHSTGPHLHFELRVRGAAVDPLTGSDSGRSAAYQCTPFIRCESAIASPEAFSSSSFFPLAAADSGNTL